MYFRYINYFYFSPLVLAYGIFIMLISGCETKTAEPDKSRIGYDYYPLETGFYRVYQVKEIQYNILTLPDTNYFQLKEIVADSFPDNTGQINYVIQRFKRENENEDWQTDSIWSTYRNDFHAVLSKNNIPVLNLVFPFEEDKRWDANSLNTKNQDDYEMTNLFAPYLLGDTDFNSAITVIQEENLDSLIFFDYRLEVYAQHIGLIDKIDSRLKFCQENDCRGQKIIKEGRQYKQSLIAYGVE